MFQCGVGVHVDGLRGTWSFVQYSFEHPCGLAGGVLGESRGIGTWYYLHPGLLVPIVFRVKF